MDGFSSTSGPFDSVHLTKTASVYDLFASPVGGGQPYVDSLRTTLDPVYASVVPEQEALVEPRPRSAAPSGPVQVSPVPPATPRPGAERRVAPGVAMARSTTGDAASSGQRERPATARGLARDVVNRSSTDERGWTTYEIKKIVRACSPFPPRHCLTCTPWRTDQVGRQTRVLFRRLDGALEDPGRTEPTPSGAPKSLARPPRRARRRRGVGDRLGRQNRGDGSWSAAGAEDGEDQEVDA